MTTKGLYREDYGNIKRRMETSTVFSIDAGCSASGVVNSAAEWRKNLANYLRNSCMLGGCLAVLVTSGARVVSGSDGSDKSKDLKVVTVLRDSDCGSDAIGRVKEVAKRLGVEVTIDEVIVETEKQIQEHRFLGSPTVRIKGLDIDPEMRGVTTYAMT